MRKPVVVLSFIAALTCPAWSDDSAPAAQQPAVQSNAQAPADAHLDETVCKKQPPPIGSRLGAKTVCMTNRQWEELYNNTRNSVRGMQNNGLGAKPLGATGS